MPSEWMTIMPMLKMKRLDIITAMPKNKHHRYLSQYHYHQQ